MSIRRFGKKKIILYSLFIFLTVFAVGYTAWDEFSGHSLREFTSSGAKPWFIAAAAGCFFLALCAEGLKYSLLYRQCEGKRNLRLPFETAILGRFYDNITPSGVGGQPFQIHYLSKNGASRGTSGAVPIAGFISSQMSFAVIAAVAFLLPIPEGITPAARVLAYIGLLCYLFVPVSLIFFALSKKRCMAMCRFFIRLLAKLRLVKDPETTGEKAESSLCDSIESLKLICANPLRAAGAFLLAILYQLFIFMIPYFILRAFGAEMGIITEITMCVYVYSSVTIIPTPGNSGAAEISFYSLFASVGSQNLFFAMLIWRFFSYYMFIISGVLIYAKNLFRHRHKGKSEAAAAE